MSETRSLRLWPGVAAATGIALLWLGVPVVAPQYGMFGVLGAMVCALLVLIWWLFFSRPL